VALARIDRSDDAGSTCERSLNPLVFDIECLLGVVSAISVRHYRFRPRDDDELIRAIEAYLKDNPCHGFDHPFNQAPRLSCFGKTRSWRVYMSLKLNLPRRRKRRLRCRSKFTTLSSSHSFKRFSTVN